MTKLRLSVYLEPATDKALAAYARSRGQSKSLVAEAAIAAFVAPGEGERQAGAIARRLDRLARLAERLERNLNILIEMQALFVRFWLTTTPPTPEAAQAAARAKGRERYAGFLAALGRRLASGRDLAREVAGEAEEGPASAQQDASDVGPG